MLTYTQTQIKEIDSLKELLGDINEEQGLEDIQLQIIAMKVRVLIASQSLTNSVTKDDFIGAVEHLFDRIPRSNTELASFLAPNGSLCNAIRNTDNGKFTVENINNNAQPSTLIGFLKSSRTEFETWRPVNWKKLGPRATAQAATTGAVAIEPLFTAFLVMSMVDGLQTILQKFQHNPNYTFNTWERILVYTLMSILGTTNLASDITTVDTASDHQKLINLLSDPERLKALDKTCVLFTVALTAYMLVFNYSVGAAADAIPINAVLKGIFGNNEFTQVLSYASLGGVTFLGDVYYLMFCTEKLYLHLLSLKNDIVLTPLAFIGRVAKRPLQYGEIALLDLFNGANRAIAFSFIYSSVAEQIFDIRRDRGGDEKVIYDIGLWNTVAAALLNLLFRGTLGVRDRYIFPKEHDYHLITYKEQLKQLRPGMPGMGTLSSLLWWAEIAVRGGASTAAVGYALSGLTPFAWPVAGVVGTVLGLHKLVVELNRATTMYALKEMQSTEPGKLALQARRDERDEENQRLLAADVQDAVENVVTAAAGQDDETYDNMIDALAADILKRLIDEYKENVVVANLARFITAGGRVSRSVGFVGFVSSVFLTILGIDLVLPLLLSVSALWVMGVIRNDQELYVGGTQAFFGEFLVKLLVSMYAEKVRAERKQGLHPYAGAEIPQVADDIEAGCCSCASGCCEHTKGFLTTVTGAASKVVSAIPVVSFFGKTASAIVHAGDELAPEAVIGYAASRRSGLKTDEHAQLLRARGLYQDRGARVAAARHQDQFVDIANPEHNAGERDNHLYQGNN